jgi:hypothetical protein
MAGIHCLVSALISTRPGLVVNKGRYPWFEFGPTVRKVSGNSTMYPR